MGEFKDGEEMVNNLISDLDNISEFFVFSKDGVEKNILEENIVDYNSSLCKLYKVSEKELGLFQVINYVYDCFS